MIPIVDPHACVSGEPASLRSYLAQCHDFHVLKMVVVQQPRESNAVMKEIRDLCDISTTRGLGGFPNKVVAYCDLLTTGSVTSLFRSELHERLQGVSYCFSNSQYDTSKSVNRVGDCAVMQTDNLDALVEKSMSLDVTINQNQSDILDVLAHQYPMLSIIVSLQGWQKPVAANYGDLESCLAKLTKHDNISIKAGLGMCVDETLYGEHLKGLINLAVRYFGYERIMFSTGDTNQITPISFTRRWRCYVDETLTFSALQRDRIFRSNAVRIYQL